MLSLQQHLDKLQRSPAPPPAPGPDHDPWRMEHSQEFISASEAAAAAGMSPWTTRADFVAAKVFGAYEEFDDASRWRMNLGKILEDDVLELAFRDNALPGEGRTYQDHEWPWLWATPDAWHTDPVAPIEVKVTAGWAAIAPPPHVITQMAVQARVCEADGVFLAVGRPHIRRLLDVQTAWYPKTDLDAMLPSDFWNRLALAWQQIR